jgi:hypothetical protein
MSDGDDAIVNSGYRPTDNAADQRTVEVPDDASSPTHRVADEILTKELQMDPDASTTLDEQPDSHQKDTKPAYQAKYQCHDPSLNARHSPAQLIRLIALCTH